MMTAPSLVAQSLLDTTLNAAHHTQTTLGATSLTVRGLLEAAERVHDGRRQGRAYSVGGRHTEEAFYGADRDEASTGGRDVASGGIASITATIRRAVIVRKAPCSADHLLSLPGGEHGSWSGTSDWFEVAADEASMVHHTSRHAVFVWRTRYITQETERQTTHEQRTYTC